MTFVWLDAEAVFRVLLDHGSFQTLDEWFDRARAAHPHITRDIFDEAFSAMRRNGWLKQDGTQRWVDSRT